MTAPEHAEMLREFRRLCSEWHRLHKIDYDAGVDGEDETCASHLAYVAMEQECRRLYQRPIADRPYGWLIGAGKGLSSAHTWGALAHAICLHSWADPVIPVTREEAYEAMGWELTPEPTVEEVKGWHRLMDAMERVEDRHTEEIDIHGMTVNSVMMDRDYFTELVANLREVEAEA